MSEPLTDDSDNNPYQSDIDVEEYYQTISIMISCFSHRKYRAMCGK